MKAHLINAAGMGMKPVIAQFIFNIQDDQQAGGDAHGHSQNIDRGKEFVFENVSECDLEVITNHGFVLVMRCKKHTPGCRHGQSGENILRVKS
jgi:hypothetical protein